VKPKMDLAMTLATNGGFLKIRNFLTAAAVIVGLILAGINLPSAKNLSGQAAQVIAAGHILTRRCVLAAVLPAHRIKPRETLYSISGRYFITPESLARLNHIGDPRRIAAGGILYIPPPTFNRRLLQLHRVRSRETIRTFLNKFQLELWQFRRLNPFLNRLDLPVGTVVILPRAPTRASRGKSGGLRLSPPVKGRLTSNFGRRWGRMHYGMDLAAPTGTPVVAAIAGEVIFAGRAGGYGLLVKVRNGPYGVNYAHLSKISVSKGDAIRRGDLIGLVGATGNARGSHLHFELELNHKKVNPGVYF